MKIIGMLCLLLFPGILTAQVKVKKGFTLNGNLTNAANRMVYLNSQNNTAKKVLYSDSTLTDARGRFMFKGAVAEPGLFSLTVKDIKGRATIYMENAAILLEGNIDSLKKAAVKGSREDMIRKEWEVLDDPIAKKRLTDEMVKNYEAAAERRDTTAMVLVQERSLKIYMDDLAKKTKTIVQKYPNSAMTVDVISNLVDLEQNQLADNLLKEVERTPAGQFTKTKVLRKRLNIRMSLSIGSKAPDFVQPDTTGKLISLSSMKGKYVLVDFWASWCGPCRAENPYLLKAYAKFKDKGFTILSVSLDDNRKAWLNAVKYDKLLWPQVSDLKAEENEVGKSYAIRGIPANFLIDPQGKIVAKNLRGDQLEKQLEKLF
ncbi:Peroxiredoxin [Pedobacter steynii]|uniref:Peroxiredoxin n=1 Tax=Pedobacter steynii TaxID=430522 RepID=A0A1G9PE92_9SPHI|nr:TlpA disulfide reductase family protein [Pedobacter steynii]NQX39010.1 AhpC/TSA family protein [Pedobacter steynii]SDL97024.1 Peroxiredoxin [Pedobacter steynii]